MATFTNAIAEATEWNFKAFVKNNELNVTNKSGRTIIVINAAGEITYQATGYTNSAAEIASKVIAKPTVEKSEAIKIEQVREKTSWLVDGKEVTNNLNWREMYNRYGMDFE